MRDLGARAGATSSYLVRRGGVQSCRLRFASAQSCSTGVGERCDSRGHGRETVRFWGDVPPPNVDAMAREKWAQVRASHRQLPKRTAGRSSASWRFPAAARMAPSAPECLAGWTTRGNRPEFDLVTGVSTGALTAPFAFLGPRYDDALKKVFTESTTSDIAIARAGERTARRGSLASNAPLAKVVAYYVNDAFLKEVAAEYMKRTKAPHRHHQSRCAAPG